MKRLVQKNEEIVSVENPYSSEEMTQMQSDYEDMSPNDFALKYKNMCFRPIVVNQHGMVIPIQMNVCDDPFCYWFGTEQSVLGGTRKKMSKYALNGGTPDNKYIRCNTISKSYPGGVVLSNRTWLVSNWSVALEYQRLITINTTRTVTPDYMFHNDDCPNQDSTPFISQSQFKKRGKSSGNSQKWQCKSCNKITNVLPITEDRFSYNQKRNDVLVDLFRLLTSRTPVKRICELLEMSPSTYYAKLEWLYRKCLEFLEMHETKQFKKISFDELWIETDKLNYFMNNIRRPNTVQRKKIFNQTSKSNVKVKEAPLFQTYAVISADATSKYVLRADLAYDYEITMDQIENDTLKFKDDHMFYYARKNASYRIPFCPQPPTPLDTQSNDEFLIELAKFEARKNYVEGLHVNSSYTAFAHFMLIQNMISAKDIRFITDEDYALISPLYRVFRKEIKNRNCHHFLCMVEKKPKNEAYGDWSKAMKNLRRWGKANNLDTKSLKEIGFKKLTNDITEKNLYNFVTVDGKKYPVWTKTLIDHPLPSRDEGSRKVACTTNLSDKSPIFISKLLMNVNHYATNSFLQQIHRRLSILERPLVTARGEGRSYIYSNCNPKYAQFALTILRTYYNFCKPYGGTEETPAQAIGIANKKYDIKDIVYFRNYS